MTDAFYSLAPEVAGGLGPHTAMDTSTHPPRVTRLHYELDGWLGDELLESFPCFIITASMRQHIEAAHASGCEFGNVEVTSSERLKERMPHQVLPHFFWFKVNGEAGRDDVGISPTHSLVVSARLLEQMKKGALRYCDIAEYTPPIADRRHT